MTNDKAIEAAVRAIEQKYVSNQLRFNQYELAKAAIAAYEAALWRDIGECLPIHGKPFLAYNPDIREFVAEWFEGIGWVYAWNQKPCTPTHFRPLPTPPKSEDEDAEG